MTHMPSVDAPHLIKAALSFLWREVGASQLHGLLPSTGMLFWMEVLFRIELPWAGQQAEQVEHPPRVSGG